MARMQSTSFAKCLIEAAFFPTMTYYWLHLSESKQIKRAKVTCNLFGIVLYHFILGNIPKRQYGSMEPQYSLSTMFKALSSTVNYRMLTVIASGDTAVYVCNLFFYLNFKLFADHLLTFHKIYICMAFRWIASWVWTMTCQPVPWSITLITLVIKTSDQYRNMSEYWTACSGKKDTIKIMSIHVSAKYAWVWLLSLPS